MADDTRTRRRTTRECDDGVHAHGVHLQQLAAAWACTGSASRGRETRRHRRRPSWLALAVLSVPPLFDIVVARLAGRRRGWHVPAAAAHRTLTPLALAVLSVPSPFTVPLVVTALALPAPTTARRRLLLAHLRLGAGPKPAKPPYPYCGWRVWRVRVRVGLKVPAGYPCQSLPGNGS
jgi:hypothetical protein